MSQTDAVSRFVNRFREDAPTQEVGIGGFKLFSRVSERSTYTSEIPTAFVEDGSPINDHVIRQPLLLRIEGVVGDVWLPQGALSREVGRAQAEVGNITQYLPSRTAAQASRVVGVVNDVADAVRRVESVVRSGEQILDLFGNNSPETPLGETFIDKMEAAYYSDQLLTVDMPYRSHKNMAIVNLVVERDNTSRATNFTIEFQKFRQADIQFSLVVGTPSPGNGGATESEADKGVQEGDEVETSVLSRILDTVGITGDD